MRRIATLIAAGFVLASGALVTTAGAASAACPTGHWPADTQGKPGNLKPLGETGLYVWHDGDGWSLRVTHSDHSHVTFEGKVTTDGRLYGTTVKAESNDHVVFSESAGGVAYKFQNYGGIDGIDFRTKCASRLTFTGSLNGKTLRPTQVFIGGNAHHPGGIPFAIRRS